MSEKESLGGWRREYRRFAAIIGAIRRTEGQGALFPLRDHVTLRTRGRMAWAAYDRLRGLSRAWRGCGPEGRDRMALSAQAAIHAYDLEWGPTALPRRP